MTKTLEAGRYPSRIWTGLALALSTFWILDKAEAQATLADLVEKTTASVGVIRGYLDADDVADSQGTGFLLEDGLLVTNWHVLADVRRATIEFPGGMPIEIRSVVASSELHDLALTKGDVPASIRPLAISDSIPRPGDSVVVIGSPLGLGQTVSSGIVSAIRQFDSRTLIQLTAPISRGSSGSPVLDLNGQVIGVATLFMFEGQNLNFAVAADSIRALPIHDPIPLQAWARDAVSDAEKEKSESVFFSAISALALKHGDMWKTAEMFEAAIENPLIEAPLRINEFPIAYDAQDVAIQRCTPEELATIEATLNRAISIAPRECRSLRLLALIALESNSTDAASIAQNYLDYSVNDGFVRLEFASFLFEQEQHDYAWKQIEMLANSKAEWKETIKYLTLRYKLQRERGEFASALDTIARAHSTASRFMASRDSTDSQDKIELLEDGRISGRRLTLLMMLRTNRMFGSTYSSGNANFDTMAAASYHRIKGALYRDLGKLDRATKELIRGIDLCPEDPQLHLELGLTFEKAGNRADAYSEYLILKRLEASVNEGWKPRTAAFARELFEEIYGRN